MSSLEQRWAVKCAVYSTAVILMCIQCSAKHVPCVVGFVPFEKDVNSKAVHAKSQNFSGPETCVRCDVLLQMLVFR